MRVWLAIVAGLTVAQPGTAKEQRPAEAAPFDFQGVALDTPFSALAKMFTPQQCSETGHETVCVVSDRTVLGSPSSVEYRFWSGKTSEMRLYQIEVEIPGASTVANVVDGLTKRWGSPQLTLSGRWIWQSPRHRLEFINLITGATIRYANTDVQDEVNAKKAQSSAAGL